MRLFVLKVIALSLAALAIVASPSAQVHAASVYARVQASGPNDIGSKIYNYVMQLVTPIQVIGFGLGALMIAVYGILFAIGDHQAMPKLWRVAMGFLLIGMSVTIAKAFAGLVGVNLP